MAMIPVYYNVRSLAVRKTTTLATAGGIGLVVFVFSSVLMLSNGLKKTMGKAGSNDVAIVLRKGADAELSSSIEDQQASVVKAAKEVSVNEKGSPRAVSEMVLVVALDRIGTYGIGNVNIRGVPDGVMDFRKGVKIVAGRAANPGTDEVVVGAAVRGRFVGLDIGQTFELKKNRPVKVVGVFTDDGSSYESEVWVDLNVGRGIFGREGVCSSVRVRLTSPESFEAFKISIEENRQFALQVQREPDFYEKQSEGTSKFIRIMGLMIAFFFSVGAMIGAMITMYSSIAHRRREIGILRALGFPQTTILLSFLIESTLLALLGGGIGAVASMGMKFVRFSTTNFANWSEIVFNFEPTPQIVVGSLLFAGLMGVLGGFFPALRAARMSPLEAMRG
jgi:putative ABC transport system permease protein